MKKKVTLVDISHECGISTAAVSMILSGKKLSRFSEETINKVSEASRRLGYQPKHGDKKDGVVMIVCPSIINPYYATLLQGMETEADREGYQTMLFNTYWDKRRETEALNLAKKPLFKGIIFSMRPQQPDAVRAFSEHFPVVMVGDKQNQWAGDTIEVNNHQAGFLLGNHLLSLGHKNICYVSTSLNNEHSSRVLRLEGLKDSFKQIGDKGTLHVLSKDIEPQEEIATVMIEHQTGHDLASTCLSLYPEVTAIVAINDMVAYGVIDLLKERNLRIPEDYSVCGFDNIYPSGFQGVELTTIDHFIFERGERAFMLLTSKIAQTEEPLASTHVEFKSQLIIRKTTGEPRDITPDTTRTHAASHRK